MAESCFFRTGRFLHALGNVTASKGNMGQSLDYHQLALKHYLATLGKNHHRTGDVHVKVAEHYIRLGQAEEAK